MRVTLRVGKKRTLTRKDFLKVASAGAALLGTSGCDRTDHSPKLPDNRRKGNNQAKNVILVIVDSLRKDHVGAYSSDWARTPSFDALAKESLLFSQAHPEAMPTIPARRAIHTGMRTFPVKAPSFG